jgi:hypothetical protein
MSLQQASYVATIAGAIGTIVVGLVTLAILHFTHRLALQSHHANVLMEFNRRFDRILSLRHNQDIDPMAYWHRFWSLQYDQFTQRQYVEEQFGYWMRCRRDEWIKEDTFREVSIKKGWADVKKKWTAPPAFIEFMEIVFSHGHDEALSRLKTRSGKSL